MIMKCRSIKKTERQRNYFFFQIKKMTSWENKQKGEQVFFFFLKKKLTEKCRVPLYLNSNNNNIKIWTLSPHFQDQCNSLISLVTKRAVTYHRKPQQGNSFNSSKAKSILLFLQSIWVWYTKRKQHAIRKLKNQNNRHGVPK